MLQGIQSEDRDCRKWQRVRETLVLPELATSIPKETRTVRHVGWDDLKRGTGQRGIGMGLRPTPKYVMDRIKAYWLSSIRLPSFGMVKLNVLPRPSSLSTQIFPPWSSINALLMANPNPVPAADLVVELSTRKNF